MPVPVNDIDSIVSVYRRRTTDFDQQHGHWSHRADLLSYARGITFLGAGACFLEGWFGASVTTVWYVAGGFLVALFLALAWLHERVLRAAARCSQLSRINRQGVARVLRKWQEIPLRTVVTPTGQQALATDLDLFGQASLFHLVCAANTPLGIATLGDWFLQPPDAATVVQRQQAVAELAPALDSRQELECRGLRVVAHRANPNQFLQWAESEPWLAQRPWLKWAARLLPLLMLIFFLLGRAALVPPSTWVAPLMINLIMGLVYRRQMHAIFGFVSNRQGEIGHYTDLFQLIADTPVTCTLLVQHQQQANAHGKQAHREIRQLGRIADFANVRFSAMSHFFMQLILSWDFHVLAILERWQARNGTHVRSWFEVLAQWEALSSLAALAHDHSTWAFPLIDDQRSSDRTFRAQGLGHPLIPDDQCVVNNVTVGPPGRLLMVTGSNMSGKSTLLRAIGTNIVLAQAGAPVCATNFTLPLVQLATSMRIDDSLADGVSFYMAELRRLKQIVDTVRSQPADADRLVLYLLDEILQGTNTAERQIAVRRVLSHLLAHGAIGAISTHDLELAAAPPLANAGDAVHFRETITSESGRHEMTFDYRLREGLATTSNALKLLEMVGLDGDTLDTTE